MAKAIRKALLLSALFFLMPLASAHSAAESRGEPSLCLCFPFPGAEFFLYRIAEFDEGGSLVPLRGYEGFAEALADGSAEALRLAAAELSQQIGDESVLADYSAIADERGLAHFPSLQPGLYLAEGGELETANGKICPGSFLISAPRLSPEGEWIYAVRADVKYTLESGESLPQTGARLLPLLCMLASGALLIILGLSLRRRKS